MNTNELPKIAAAAVQEMAHYWEAMVGDSDDAAVRLAMSKRVAPNEEMRRIENQLERETHINAYAQLCARYVTVFKGLVRMAVIEVRIGGGRW